MTIDEKFVALLAKTQAVTKIIGASGSCRLYPGVAKVDDKGFKFPYCTYTLIRPFRHYSHQGFAGVENTQYQISCFANSYAVARTLSIAIVKALEAWKGAGIQSVTVPDAGHSLYDSETKVHHIPITFEVWAAA